MEAIPRDEGRTRLVKVKGERIKRKKKVKKVKG
jgi:hypothetical protein